MPSGCTVSRRPALVVVDQNGRQVMAAEIDRHGLPSGTRPKGSHHVERIVGRFRVPLQAGLFANR